MDGLYKLVVSSLYFFFIKITLVYNVSALCP